MHSDHSDVEEVLGAYALDAVDEDERRRVEAHLAGCARCRAEVQQHRETVATLWGGDAPAPEHVWDGITAAMKAAAADRAPVVTIDRRRWSPSRMAAWTGAVAAALMLVMAVGLVLQARQIDDLEETMADQEQQISQLAAALETDPRERAVTAAIQDPASLLVTLTAEADPAEMLIVLAPDGTGYVVSSSLAALPANRTYQLWAVVDDKVISAGVLGRDPALAPFHVDLQGLRGLVITEEVQGGVEKSANAPVVAWFDA